MLALQRKRTIKFLTWALLGASLGIAGPSGAETSPTCDRSCLETTVAKYATALVMHDPSALSVTSDIKVSDNGQLVALGAGASWKAITAFKSQPQFIADVPAQQVGYLGVVEDGGKPAFFALRLKLISGRIAEAESVLTHEGEGGPAFLPEGFIYREAPYIRDVPLKVRSSRSELLSVANRYWDVSTSSHDGAQIPHAVDCWHFENGMNTTWERDFFASERSQLDQPAYRPQDYDGRIWTCAREVYLTSASWTGARDRTFVVDQERGLVLNLAYVDPKPRPSPLSLPPSPTEPGAKAVVTATPNLNPESPIDGPGKAPLGISMTAMRAAMGGPPQTMAHFLLMRIVDGKITREQDVMHALPANAQRAFAPDSGQQP